MEGTLSNFIPHQDYDSLRQSSSSSEPFVDPEFLEFKRPSEIVGKPAFFEEEDNKKATRFDVKQGTIH